MQFKANATGYFIDSTSLDTLARLNIETLETDYNRDTGMTYRQPLEDNQGVLFLYDEERIMHFYMKNTPMSLDLLYLDRDGKVDSYFENAKPMDTTNMSSMRPVPYILEVKGGQIKKWNLKKGDVLEWEKF